MKDFLRTFCTFSILV